ncbi:CAP domain-containing protein [Coniochaeta sp. 2T2.1]|nr:CAP domain-containing protein [Coniochaeta sp. 2T2.1]
MRFSITTALTAALCFVSATTALTTDQQSALDIHNKGRKAKSLPLLTWDNALVTSAQQCANKIAASGNFAHCQSGENLYAQYGSTAPPQAAGAQAWMNEAPVYKGELIPQGNFAGYGHYTQAMWKNTKKVGLAVAKGSNGWTYVVAHYDPAGNVVGQKPY